MISDDIELSDNRPTRGAVEAMQASPRCGAKTRSGAPCASPAVAGKRRCRMHGGAPGSGAPLGNKNALKHGEYSRETKEDMKRIHALTRDAMAALKRL
jgi:hypothetical protein